MYHTSLLLWQNEAYRKCLLWFAVLCSVEVGSEHPVSSYPDSYSAAIIKKKDKHESDSDEMTLRLSLQELLTFCKWEVEL